MRRGAQGDHAGLAVIRHKITIISEQTTDHLVLAASLERALPERFVVSTAKNLDRPLEALADPEIDAIIMADGPQTDYILRLAQKHDSSVPIVLLMDDADEDTVQYLKALGAQDYLVRGQLEDGMVHRILDYSIQLRQARNRIQQLSNRDSLTGVLNRSGFRAHLERAMERSRRYQFNTALLYINIDEFANVNDHHGELAGDDLIRTLARRMVHQLRNGDSIARIGGDEFAVVLEDVASASDVEMIANKMLKSISDPIMLGEQQVSVNASIGAALFPEDTEELADLIEQARHAMQQAKSVQGCRYARYSREIQFDAEGGTSLAAELRTAVRKNQFELHYQPRVDANSGELRGLEALLRWNHPDRGMLCPQEFISTCDDMGLLKTIGYQVIQHACSAQVWLSQQGLDTVDVAVNISFSQIQDEQFVPLVKDILAHTGANAQRIEMELTESTILMSPAEIKSCMDELRLLGVSFSLDDFGTGFSQLSHLTELPIAALKIDSSFVSELPHNTQHAAICSMIIEMARRLEMPVVAEGVETFEQLEFLRENNCDQVQGFYYSPAIPLQRLPRFVQEQRFKSSERIIS